MCGLGRRSRCARPLAAKLLAGVGHLRRPGLLHLGDARRKLLRLIRLRTQNPAFRHSETELAETGNDHVLGFLRTHAAHTVFVLANFSEREQVVEARRLRQKGMRKTVLDLYTGRTLNAVTELTLEPYQLMFLSRGPGG